MNAQSTHVDTSLFRLDNKEYLSLLDWFLIQEMNRDCDEGDITSKLILNETPVSIVAKVTIQDNGILAGREEVEWFLSHFDIDSVWYVKDSEEIRKGDILLELQGSAEIILKVERTLLNFLGRMCGIATITHQCIQEVPENVLVCPTRKTLWGLLDKKACWVGGGGTHRLHASSAFLAKENHIALLKQKNIQELGPILKIHEENLGKFCEIEVENEKEAFDAIQVLSQLTHTQGIIMLDNFDPETLSVLVLELKQKNKKIFLEASGGINLENIALYGHSGVDIVSLGLITHSAPHFPLSMRLSTL